MALHWLFPTPVLQADLEPDVATAAAMQQQLEQFDAQVYPVSYTHLTLPTTEAV